MHIIIEAEPKEIAALVVGLQGQQEAKINVSEAIRGTLLESAGKSQKYQ